MVLLGSKEGLIALQSTLFRCLVGFLIAAVWGILLGIITGLNHRLYAILELPIDFFRSFPAPALFPLFMLFLGIGDKAKMAVVVFSCGLIMVVYTANAVRNCDPIKLMVAKVLRMEGIHLWARVILPEIAPEIAGGLRVSLSISLILVIVLEMLVGGSKGLGRLLYDRYLTFRTSEMFATFICIGLLGYALNYVFRTIEGRMLHWAGK